MAKKRPKECFLCGQMTATEKEHVPPHCLSPMTPRDGFFMLPVCSSCNRSTSREEEKLRDVLAVACAFKGNKSADDAYKKMKSSFSYGYFQRAGAPGPAELRIRENLRRVNMFTENGIFLGQETAIYMPKNLDIHRIMVKQASGMHYHFYSYVVPYGCEIEVKAYPTTNILQTGLDANIISKMQIAYAGDYFGCVGVSIKSAEEFISIWLITFYEQVMFSVTFDKSKIQ